MNYDMGFILIELLKFEGLPELQMEQAFLRSELDLMNMDGLMKKQKSHKHKGHVLYTTNNIYPLEYKKYISKFLEHHYLELFANGFVKIYQSKYP